MPRPGDRVQEMHFVVSDNIFQCHRNVMLAVKDKLTAAMRMSKSYAVVPTEKPGES